MPAIIPIIYAASSIAAATIASHAAKDAAQKQTDAANHGADLQSEANKNAETFSRQQAENDWRNQELTRRGNYDQAQARNSGVRSLGASIGFDLPEMPAYSASQDPRYDTGHTPVPGQPPAPGTPPTAPQGVTGGADQLKALLTSGLSPQDAAKKFNQQYGRTTGNEAVFYPENGTVSIPEGYFSNGATGWNFAARGNAGRSTPQQTPYAPGSLGAITNTDAPVYGQRSRTLTPYQPGTIGFTLGQR